MQSKYLFKNLDFSSFGIIPRSEITGLYDSSILIFEEPPYYFHGCYTKSPSGPGVVPTRRPGGGLLGQAAV